MQCSIISYLPHNYGMHAGIGNQTNHLQFDRLKNTCVKTLGGIIQELMFHSMENKSISATIFQK